MDDRRFRWGILGTGRIAASFATDLARLPDAELVAVGSRSPEGAERFGQQFGAAHRHASYEALVADDDVDVVYVATPHPGHHPAALLAIEAGKAVLVEKPFTVNAEQARELVAAARARSTFLMEAMWARFMPHYAHVRALLAEGALGDVRTVIVDHGQWFERDASSRLFDRTLGGGALLDLGIYAVSFASMVLGTPTRVLALSDPAFTGVDATTSALLQHDGGRHAVVTTTLEATGSNRAAIIGTEARLELHSRFYRSPTLTLTSRDDVVEVFEAPAETRGLRHQAAEVMRCLREGRTESEVMPLDETVSIMATMDEIRRQIGLAYPGE
ncbi:MAG: hypothetical protein QOI54_895 [Actinomycetota bacterium]|jgi:predicted dehydrogenase|nr:hypothetical protein [Actinomycetota bacterium]